MYEYELTSENRMMYVEFFLAETFNIFVYGWTNLEKYCHILFFFGG